MHDFVVVGAGPAGSRFARSAAERGRDVLVLESGEIGRPLACSGHVSLDIWEFVPGETRPEGGSRNGRAESRESEVPSEARNLEASGDDRNRDDRHDLFQNDIYGARFHLGGAESGSYPFYKDEPVSNAIDRVGLDKTLAECAREAGAEVRDGYTVTGVTELPGRVEVTARGPDGIETFEARMVCGADGPRSRVRDEVGLPEPEELLHGVLGFEFDPDHQDFVDVHLTVPRFFAWRIPRGDAGVEYGLAVAPGDDAPGRFGALCAEYDVDLDERCSGAIPIAPPDRTVGKRSFLVGDAAAQTKPFTGGGILYGMRAADIAAREIDPSQPATLDDYERGWRSELSRDQSLGKLVRAGYSMPKPVQRAGLRAFAGEIAVHMDRPTSLFSRAQLRAMVSWE
ncbi:MAG: geranylgeranyl reductase family protein [Natronomonas sp.]|jgi:geranylgeranyl reductase family protein|uniref:geranylgeranyl reductase family protein n=1 Tax=Natronomonas sp. TaxID=2184060 RepID=UPI003989F8FF